MPGTAAGIYAGGKLSSFINAANDNVASRVGESAADAQKAAQALQRYQQSGRSKTNFITQLLLGTSP
jgi:hypothetical protein